MIRRSFNPRFRQPILDEIKITTIRDTAWPVGVPIMAFNWSGLPYRSKQETIAPVVVEFVQGIDITHAPGGMVYSSPYVAQRPLFGTEGFSSPADMDAWFTAVVKPGHTVTKFLHRFRLWTCGDSDRYFELHGKLP